MDGQFDVIVWLRRPLCVCVASVRANAVVDELFIFYGISVKLSTILSTYHGHCLFIMRICCCVFTCQFSWTMFLRMWDQMCCVQVFLVVLVTHTHTLSLFSFLFHPRFRFIFRSSLLLLLLSSSSLLQFFILLFYFSSPLFWRTSVLIIALWSMFANLHLDLPNNCQFYSINCNHFSKLYAAFFSLLFCLFNW